MAQQPQRPEPKGKPGIGIPAGDTPQMDDGEIIERARDAANRAKFMALFDGGDTSAYGGDDSAADLALCELLVFWTQDEAQIDRIFRRSALMREKWDEKHYSDGSSYGAGTIRKALEMSAGGERYTREPPRAQGTAAGAVLTPTVTIRQVAPEAGPVLREDALYGLAGRLVRAILPHTEADAANLLINLLVMFGNAAGGTYHTYADGFRHGLNLFATVVGPTNAAKGTGTQRAFDVLRRVDEVWAKTRKQAGLSSGEGVIAAVQDQEDGPTDKRLFLYESEFGSTLKIMGREGNSLSGILRQAWDSGDLCTLTKVPVRAGDAHISIIAHITPAELKKRLSETDAANGFANRFLWVCVDRSKRLPGGTGEPSVAPLIAELHKALQFARHHSQTVRRTPQAEDLWGSTTSA